MGNLENRVLKHVLAPFQKMIAVHTNIPENTYHMIVHVHWARMCRCKQEADTLQLQKILYYTLYYIFSHLRFLYVLTDLLLLLYHVIRVTDTKGWNQDERDFFLKTG